MKTLVKLLFTLTLCLLASTLASAQPTYTNAEFVASAPIAWQVHSDPASRMTIGNDDGNVFAVSHSTAYASALKYNTAQGLEGLLYDFTISTEGAPIAFGLARSGCMANSPTTLDTCVRARWVPAVEDGSIMSATLIFPDFAASYLEYNVQPGESFSIERVGNHTINFYRSTGVSGERRRVVSSPSPFASDGYPNTTFIEPRVVFAPDSTTKKLSNASELYYCCL